MIGLRSEVSLRLHSKPSAARSCCERKKQDFLLMQPGDYYTMDGLSIVFLSIFIWIFSLCIVLVGAQRKHAFSLLSGAKRNAMLVIAHPDDESMFFSPTIIHLMSGGHRVYVLCLSTGNADGEGNVRMEELYKACSVFKVPFQNIKVLNHPELQDGFSEMWSHQILVKIFEDEITSWNVDLIITFDKYGVSRHPNHCDVHHGICLLLRDKFKSIEAWELVSTNILRKYSGPVDIWLSFLAIHCRDRQQLCCLVNHSPTKSFLAMAQHASQWIWFRKLFVVFSSYTYVNTIRRIRV